MKIRHESPLHHPPRIQNRHETAIQGLHSSFDIPNSSFLRPPQKQFPSRRYPKNWNGGVVIWLDDNGKSVLQNDDVKKLVAAGNAIVGANRLFQGGEPVRETRVVANPHGFCFGQVLSYRDPMFLPGGSKYLDLAGFINLNGSNALWLKGEGKEPEGSAAEFLNQ